MGKFHPSFQEYLQNPSMPRDVRDHSSAGAVYVQQAFGSYGELLANLIAGHHSGLLSFPKLKNRLAKAREEQHVKTAIQLGVSSLGDVPSTLELPSRWAHILHRPEAAEVWMRMLFSCLVDADFLDTESHFTPEHHVRRQSWKHELHELWNRYEEHQKQFRSRVTDSPLNHARQCVFEQCLERATEPTGLFQLNVPTGMGKTLSGMGFALRHALHHSKNRVIVAVPFSSILDQNAKVYQNILGDESVLEHHSAMEVSSEHELEDRRKLATENWDAPIIVTTTVQFFESLFARRTSAVRKVHRIANSVVILDEVQMLPFELLEPIFSMIRELTLHYNVTFLLSSATPLALDLAISKVKDTLPPCRDLVQDSGRLFEEFRRVEYDVSPLAEDWSWVRVAEEVRQYEQVMVIVNRRQDAVALYRKLQGEGVVYHLSASMCPAHRKQVLQTIRQRLQEGHPIWLVATQVVEAGVDLDFPVVMRALGPLDRIVQAAGRCNREGRLERGRMIVFRPSEGGIPRGNYRTMTDKAEQYLIRDAGCLERLETFERYFRDVYGSVNTDGKEVEALRRSVSPLDFPEIERKFRMIEGDSVSVLVEYGEESKKLREQLAYMERVSRSWMRQAQMYAVSVNRNSSVFREGSRDLRELAEGWYEWNGRYDPEVGLVVGMEYAPENLCL